MIQHLIAADVRLRFEMDHGLREAWCEVVRKSIIAAPLLPHRNIKEVSCGVWVELVKFVGFHPNDL